MHGIIMSSFLLCSPTTDDVRDCPSSDEEKFEKFTQKVRQKREIERVAEEVKREEGEKHVDITSAGVTANDADSVSQMSTIVGHCPVHPLTDLVICKHRKKCSYMTLYILTETRCH